MRRRDESSTPTASASSRARALALALIAIGCGAEPRTPAEAPPPRTEPRRVATAQPEPPPEPPADDTAARRPPPGAPTVDAPRATLWTDPAAGLVLRAERLPGEPPGWGEVTVVARGRNAPAHLVREWDGDLYWVEHRRADARCDFVRLASGASAPEILWEDDLGDFAETVCDTAIAVDPGARHLIWIHGSEIRAAPPVRGARAVVLARGQPFAREIATDETHVYWLALGADPYADDLTGRGSLRAVPIAGGRVQVIADGLTEPRALVVTPVSVELREQSEAGEQLRSYPRAGAPIRPG